MLLNAIGLLVFCVTKGSIWSMFGAVALCVIETLIGCCLNVIG